MTTSPNITTNDNGHLAADEQVKSNSDQHAAPVIRRITVDRDKSTSTPTTVGGGTGDGDIDERATPVIRLSSFQSTTSEGNDVSPSSVSRPSISMSSSHSPTAATNRRSSSPPILDVSASSMDPLDVARELLASESALRRLQETVHRSGSEHQKLGRHGGASAAKQPLLYKLTDVLQRRLPACGLSDDAMARAHACASVGAAVRDRRGSGVWAPGGGPMRSGGDTVVNEDVLLDTVIYALCFAKVRLVQTVHDP